MSYVLGQLTACPTIQRELTEYFMTCPVNEFMPFFEFVNSPVNNIGLTQEVAPGGGKIRTVRLTYTPRQLESAVTANIANPKCDVSNFIGDRYTDYTLDTDENQGIGFSMTAQELEAACIANETYFVRRLADLIDALDRKLATEHTADLASLVGKWASNVTMNASNEFVVNTLQAGSTMIDPQTTAKIDFAMQKTGYCNESMIFAGSTLAEYYRATSSAGCCTQQGIDVATIFNQYGKAVAYDRRIESVFGTDEAVAIQAGSLTLLSYTRSPWKEGMPLPYRDAGNYISTVIRSPRTGIPMDLTVSDNCGTVSVSLVATTKLVGLPLDIYAQGDFMSGVNYMAKIKVTNS
jgi:hypothetical protein